jgi:hypothetical protein
MVILVMVILLCSGLRPHRKGKAGLVPETNSRLSRELGGDRDGHDADFASGGGAESAFDLKRHLTFKSRSRPMMMMVIAIASGSGSLF